MSSLTLSLRTKSLFLLRTCVLIIIVWHTSEWATARTCGMVENNVDFCVLYFYVETEWRRFCWEFVWDTWNVFCKKIYIYFTCSFGMNAQRKAALWLSLSQYVVHVIFASTGPIKHSLKMHFLMLSCSDIAYRCCSF